MKVINILALDFCQTDAAIRIFSFLGILLKMVFIIIPIIIVILGSFDLMKAVVAQKEDEIKKGYQILIKRIIIGVVIFFIVPLIRLIIGLANEDIANSDKNICLKSFLYPNEYISKLNGITDDSPDMLCDRYSGNKKDCDNNKCSYNATSNKCSNVKNGG